MKIRMKKEGECNMSVIIKPFSTPMGYYVYDREINSILVLSQDRYEAFERIYKKQANEEDQKILKDFQEQGYCKESQLEKIEHPTDKLLEFHLENKIKKITLQVTQNCNLRCSYCIYSGMYEQRSHTNKTMSYETMKESVDFLMKHSTNSEMVDIGFYGGEPLLAFNNIKSLLTYIKTKYPYKKVTYSMTTNGTIFNDEIIEFLSDNNVSLMISIDGPKELHDKNRVFINGKGSFEPMMENLLYIKNKNPEFFEKITFSTVIAPGNDYKCITDFFNASDVIEDTSFFSTTINDYNSKETIQYEESFFINYRIQRTKMLLAALGIISKDQVSKLLSSEMVIISRFHKDLGMSGGLTKMAHPGGPCIPGAHRLMVDVNGNLYPCERVSETSESMCIGSLDSGFNLDKARAILNIGQITSEECKECWNFIHCNMCAAAADDSGKLSKKKKLNRCSESINNTLSMLKTVCLLKENNFNFEKENRYEL